MTSTDIMFVLRNVKIQILLGVGGEHTNSSYAKQRRMTRGFGCGCCSLTEVLSLDVPGRAEEDHEYPIRIAGVRAGVHLE
jgi:hypothetical protein